MTSFKQMQKDGTIKRADARLVRLEDIHEEPGFNLRDETAVDPETGETFQQSIERLADYIAQGGQYPALEVRPRAEGGVWIVDGHRRVRALRMCVANGVPLADDKGDVWVSIVPFEGNDAERTARIITSREGRSLSPLEVAAGYKRLRAFGWDNARIAQKVGKTPQHVAQLLMLANADCDVQGMVAAGAVSAAVAVDVVRKHGDDAGKVLADAAGKARAQGKKKVTAGTMNGKSLPRGVVDEVEKTLNWFSDEGLDTQARAAVKLAEDDPAQYGQVVVQVTAGALAELMSTAALVKDAREKQEAKAREAAAKAAQTDLADAA
jgi:ParB-like chromosome segregation protein Spo0J